MCGLVPKRLMYSIRVLKENKIEAEEGIENSDQRSKIDKLGRVTQTL